LTFELAIYPRKWTSSAGDTAELSSAVHPGMFHYYRQWHRTGLTNESSSLKNNIIKSQEQIFFDLEERRPPTIVLEGLTVNKGENPRKNFHSAFIAKYGKSVRSTFNKETYTKGVPLNKKQRDMLYEIGGAVIHSCLAKDIEVLAPCTYESLTESQQAQKDEFHFAESTSQKNKKSRTEDWSEDDHKKYAVLQTISAEKRNVCDEQLLALLISFRRQRPNDDAGIIMGAMHDIPMLLRKKNPSASIKMIDHLSTAPIGPTRADMPPSNSD